MAAFCGFTGSALGVWFMAEALEANPDWVYNDGAPWNYHALPAAFGCQGWFTAKVSTLGELDAALARASTAESSRVPWPRNWVRARSASMPSPLA